ncbi:MAG: type II secretion system protein GspM [Pseudomonadota bacterium]
MSAASLISQLREQGVLQWQARTEQERRFLGIGAAVVAVALLYVTLVEPAVSGRAQAKKDLPVLRESAAQMQALGAEAATLARQPAIAVVPMTQEGLSARLAARSLKAASITMTGDYAKLQLKDVSFASLMAWLDAERREHRIGVSEANLVPQAANAGQVDGVLTLRQARIEGQR